MPADDALPPIPAKRYFSISEVAQLCNVKPYVLRYWEQEFTRQLHPSTTPANAAATGASTSTTKSSWCAASANCSTNRG